MTNEMYLTAYGDFINIPTLKFTHERKAIINVNGQYNLLIQEKSSDELLISLLLCSIERNKAEEISLKLLSLNLYVANLSGAYLTWNDVNSSLYLLKKISTSNTTVIEFATIVKGIIDDAYFLNEHLQFKSTI